ncbi:MAG: hypothetical protein ACPGIA_11135 [Luteolibacter sp.]
MGVNHQETGMLEEVGAKLKKFFEICGALLIAMPNNYAELRPGLKNAIDWVSHTTGEDTWPISVPANMSPAISKAVEP